MRLIDADALIIDYYDDYETKDDEYTYAYVSKSQIDSAPSIDIVRCKECRWRGIPTACPIDNFYAQRWTKDDDYCSYGERKESE